MGKERILIIDDEPSFTRLLRLNLEQAGRYEVREVNEGARALAEAEAFHPDLILLDIIMPDADGAAIGAQLREHATLNAIPIVFLTAVVSKEEARDTGGYIGGNFFLAKPVSMEELLSSVEAKLSQGKEAHR
ncbi:MAG: response regulator [Candidatus Omnitrophica bacterium]|nr:response regulator [Candidatus Omnitrophota bacterium]